MNDQMIVLIGRYRCNPTTDLQFNTIVNSVFGQGNSKLLVSEKMNGSRMCEVDGVWFSIATE